MHTLSKKLGLFALTLIAIGCGRIEPEELAAIGAESIQSQDDNENLSLSQSRNRKNKKKKSPPAKIKKTGVIVLERALRVQTKIKNPVTTYGKLPTPTYKNCTIPAAAQLESVSDQGNSMSARVRYPRQMDRSLRNDQCKNGSFVVINTAALQKLRGLVLVAAQTSFEKAPIPMIDVPEREPALRAQLSLPYDPSFDSSRCTVYPNRSNIRITGFFKDAAGVVHLKALAVSSGILGDQMFRLDECEDGTKIHAQLSEIVQSISPVRALSASVE